MSSLHLTPQEARKKHGGLRLDHSAYSLPTYPSRPSCRRCPLHLGARNVGVPTAHVRGTIPPAPSVPAVVVIGQNPGAHEDETNLPFIGQSGYILHYAYLGGLHLDHLASVYVTNVVRCLTPQNSKPPYKECCVPCFPYTLEDLDHILSIHTDAPVCLLLVGAPAVAACWRLLFSAPTDLSLEESFTRNGLTLTPTSLTRARPLTVFHTYHPAHFSRTPNVLLEIHSHLGQLSAFLQGRTPPVSKPHIVPPFDPHTPGAFDAALSTLPIPQEAPTPRYTPQPIPPPPDDDIPF